DTPPVEPARFQPLSTAEAVLRYAGDFLPSWAGAISIDLMPAVLVLILCVVHAAIRRDGEPVAADSITAAQMLTALRLARDLGSAHPVSTVAGDAQAPPLQPLAEDNIATLSAARAGKKDWTWAFCRPPGLHSTAGFARLRQ